MSLKEYINEAESFNQDLSGWDVSGASNYKMFSNTKFPDRYKPTSLK